MPISRIGPVRTAGASGRRPAKAKVTRARLADAILDLQRSAGNAAVASHLADVRAGHPAPALLPMQRCGPTPCDCADDERAEYATTHADEHVVQRDTTDDLAEFIAKDLAQYTAQTPNPFPHLREVFHQLDSDIQDNVAAAFTEKLVPQQLEVFAMTKEGRDVLDMFSEAMLTGHVTAFEALQGDRILAARDRWMSADEHDKAVRRIAELRHHAEDSDVQKSVNEHAQLLAVFLRTLVVGRDFGQVIDFIRQVGDNVEDNVSSHLIEMLTTLQLEDAAKDPAGRLMLDVCYDALITGTVTPFESFQGDRILAARVKGRAIGPGELETVMQNPTIFPLETSWDSSATIVASLQTDGMVKVYYDTHTGARRPKYADEMRILFERFGYDTVFSGMTLKPDEVVMVKLYDQDEATVPVPAIKLIDLANRQLQDFEGKFEKVTILGATVGLGAVGGAGVLGMLDTAAFAISTASIFVDAYRSDIAKTAGGRAFLEVWDVVQGVADLYGWARLGVDGLNVLKAKVGPVLRDWKAEPLTGLSNAERATVGQAQREADKWIGGVEQAEAAEAKAAGAGEHPPTGEHPADEGGAHPADAREPTVPHDGGAAGAAAANESSKVVGEAGSEIHVHDDRVVVCQLCEDLPVAVGDAVHDPKVGGEVTDAEQAAAHGDAAGAVAKAEGAVVDAEKVNAEALKTMKKRFRREFSADPTLEHGWEQVKAMKPGPERAAAARDLEARANALKTTNDAYLTPVREKVKDLRARSDPAGERELREFYGTQPEWVLSDLQDLEKAELKKVKKQRGKLKPTPDRDLDDALKHRRAETEYEQSKLKEAAERQQGKEAHDAVMADDDRHLPHEADVLVVDDRGKIVVPERHFVSGAQTEAERAQYALTKHDHDFNEANTETHTEAKALHEIGVHDGETMYIYGQYDPCKFCRKRMQDAVNRFGGKVIYIWPGGPAGGMGFVKQ